MSFLNFVSVVFINSSERTTNLVYDFPAKAFCIQLPLMISNRYEDLGIIQQPIKGLGSSMIKSELIGVLVALHVRCIHLLAIL